MTWLKNAWAWIRKHGAIVLGGLALLLGAYIIWRRYHDKLGSLSDALEVERARREIATLQERRDQLVARADSRALEVAAIEQEIVAQQRRAVEATYRVEAMTDEEVVEAFGRLGY